MNTSTSTAATSAANAAITAANAAISAAVSQQREALLAHFRANKALSAETAIQADALKPAWADELKYYSELNVIRCAGTDSYYLDLEALEKSVQHQAQRTVRVLAWTFGALVALMVACIGLWALLSK